MIIGYARVSTQDQNLDLQTKALKEAGCEKIFADKASGSNIDRPQLKKCLNFLSTGDTLIVWKLDRLSRSLMQLVNVVQSFNDRGIGFKVITAPIDTTTSQGKLIFGIFASLAEFERSLIRERVQAGVDAAIARGVKFGRPTVTNDGIIGQYRLQHTTTGISVREFAKQIGISKSALYRALKPPTSDAA